MIKADTKIKDWYTKAYTTDEMGEYIKEGITFYDLFYAMDNYADVYEFIGVDDSIIRERIFEALSKVMSVDYDYIYDQWLLSANQ